MKAEHSKLRENSEQCSLFLFVMAAVFVLLGGCQPRESKPTQTVFSGPMMGTKYRITVIRESDHDDKVLEQRILSVMNSVNKSMSNYLANSELSKFNQSMENQEQTISPSFHEVMFEALFISKLTHGAFDVTLAKAVDAWGFGPEGAVTHRPNRQEIEKLRESAGFEKLRLGDNTLMKTVAGVEINLSAIAKGYAVDQVALELDSQGVENYLINIGGELRASGKSLDNQFWRVGIEKPHVLGGIQEIAKLGDVSIATSGDYRNYLVIDGEQFSHTIDPRTLMPVFHKLALVSIISERASTADALATALMAMGETRAWAFAQEQGLAAYLVVRGDVQGEYRVQLTQKFKAYLQ